MGQNGFEVVNVVVPSLLQVELELWWPLDNPALCPAHSTLGIILLTFILCRTRKIWMKKTLKSSWQKTHSLVSQMWVDVESISSSTFNLSKENVWYKEPNLWSEILKLLQLYTLRISSLSWRVFPDILAFRLLWNTLIQQQTLKVLRQCCSMAKTAKAIEF